jgi:hypothetical protein
MPINNANGDIAFSTLLSRNSTSGITGANIRAIFVTSIQDALYPVALKGDPVTEGAYWSSFKDPILNDNGDVAWLGSLSGPAVTKESNTAIWHLRGYTEGIPGVEGPQGPQEARSVSESGTLVAREGSPVPGIEGANWLKFISVALPNGFPSNGPIFVARIAPDTTS